MNMPLRPKLGRRLQYLRGQSRGFEKGAAKSYALIFRARMETRPSKGTHAMRELWYLPLFGSGPRGFQLSVSQRTPSDLLWALGGKPKASALPPNRSSRR